MNLYVPIKSTHAVHLPINSHVTCRSLPSQPVMQHVKEGRVLKKKKIFEVPSIFLVDFLMFLFFNAWTQSADASSYVGQFQMQVRRRLGSRTIFPSFVVSFSLSVPQKDL